MLYKREITSRWDQSYRPHHHITILTKQSHRRQAQAKT